jgi:hypothetical protein
LKVGVEDWEGEDGATLPSCAGLLSGLEAMEFGDMVEVLAWAKKEETGSGLSDRFDEALVREKSVCLPACYQKARRYWLKEEVRSSGEYTATRGDFRDEKSTAESSKDRLPGTIDQS